MRWNASAATCHACIYTKTAGRETPSEMGNLVEAVKGSQGYSPKKAEADRDRNLCWLRSAGEAIGVRPILETKHMLESQLAGIVPVNKARAAGAMAGKTLCAVGATFPRPASYLVPSTYLPN